MRTVYDLYHWNHPDAAAEVTYGFDTMHAAALATAENARGVPADFATDPDKWVRTRNDDGWILADWWLTPLGVSRSPWGIFERRVAENDTERVQLALELLERDGQVDGQHHQRWVIDQTVRILSGDGYDEQGQPDTGPSPLPSEEHPVNDTPEPAACPTADDTSELLRGNVADVRHIPLARLARRPEIAATVARIVGGDTSASPNATVSIRPGCARDRLLLLVKSRRTRT